MPCPCPVSVQADLVYIFCSAFRPSILHTFFLYLLCNPKFLNCTAVTMRFSSLSIVTNAFRRSRGLFPFPHHHHPRHSHPIPKTKLTHPLPAPPLSYQPSFAHRAAAAAAAIHTTASRSPRRRSIYEDLEIVYSLDELRDQAAKLELEQAALNSRMAELDALAEDYQPYTREDAADALVVASRVADLKRAGHIALCKAVRAGGSFEAAGASSAGASKVDVRKVDVRMVDVRKVDVLKVDGSVGVKRFGVIASHYGKVLCRLG